MKAYTYSAQELGLQALPQGLLRLTGAEAVSDPRQADVFVVPVMMMHVGMEALQRLPYLHQYPERHVLMNIGEWMGQALGLPAIMFRCDTTQTLLARDPTALAWPWPVEDLGAWADRPFARDVTFQGWVSTGLTDTVCDAVLATPSLTTHIQRHKFFYGYEDESQPSTQALRRTFLETLASSRLSLVARSIPEGVVRYRFYEALSMGRIPVHFCDGRVLPFADRIDYDVCSVHIPEADAPRAGEVIAAWLADRSDAEIRERGAYGRAMWARWLDSRKWPELMAEVVKEKLA